MYWYYIVIIFSNLESGSGPSNDFQSLCVNYCKFTKVCIRWISDAFHSRRLCLAGIPSGSYGPRWLCYNKTSSNCSNSEGMTLVFLLASRLDRSTHLEEINLLYIRMGVSKIGVPPNHPIHFNRVFHYKPSILGYHYFWKHPYNYLNI